jgi:hypothetical protein
MATPAGNSGASSPDNAGNVNRRTIPHHQLSGVALVDKLPEMYEK